MSVIWKARGNYETVRDAVLSQTGVSIEELQSPVLEDPREINEMLEATSEVVQAILNKRPITIVGDYDSDGLNATAILVKLLNYYSVTPQAIIPRRMTEGYGLSQPIVERIPDGNLVITIDNGITAVEEVELLSSKGCTVIIMDHHLPGEDLPSADFLIDPHVDPEANGFRYYCGAGLGLQMARLMLETDQTEPAQRLMKELTVHAAIATITDVMPLLGCNRAIVKQGLYLMNHELSSLSAGLQALRSAAGEAPFSEDAIGYKLGPIINAPARLYDAGGTSVLKELTCWDVNNAQAYMSKMLEINEARKQLVQEHLLRVVALIEDEGLLDRGAPLCVSCPQLPEGIIGIVAGKVAELYQIPAFIFSECAEPGVLKGSGRSNGGMDLTPLLDAARHLVVKCGGHAGAAGISVEQAKFTKMAEAMRKAAQEATGGLFDHHDITYEYDVELCPELAAEALSEVRLYAPYGEGVHKPVFLIRGFETVMKFGAPYRFMGQNKDHLKLNGHYLDAIGFGMGEKYCEMGMPLKVDILCTLGENVYQGKSSIQAEIVDFRPAV